MGVHAKNFLDLNIENVYSLGLIQFDYLKSLEIEEKINKIRWCQSSNGALFLLSTNDRTIKLWKVGKGIFSILDFTVMKLYTNYYCDNSTIFSQWISISQKQQHSKSTNLTLSSCWVLLMSFQTCKGTREESQKSM